MRCQCQRHTCAQRSRASHCRRLLPSETLAGGLSTAEAGDAQLLCIVLYSVSGGHLSECRRQHKIRHHLTIYVEVNAPEVSLPYPLSGTPVSLCSLHFVSPVSLYSAAHILLLWIHRRPVAVPAGGNSTLLPTRNLFSSDHYVLRPFRHWRVPLTSSRHNPPHSPICLAPLDSLPPTATSVHPSNEPFLPVPCTAT